ncbi:hypothetical protein LG315_12140 [Microbacterium marinum]|uniref:hypothetical protein n=1 Tax=Microbacterium marinum TaxID=421115 RepID=UPI00384E0AA8
MTSVIQKAGGLGTVPGPQPRSQFHGRRRPGELIIKTVLRLAAILTIVTTAGILVALLIPSLSLFR